MIMLDIKKVKPGDIVAFTYYVRAENAPPVEGNFRDRITATDIKTGVEGIVFRGPGVLDKGISADNYDDEKSVTKTEIAELFVGAGDKPFTVWFIKVNGDTRKLRGHLVKQEPLLGRSYVIDLDAEGSPLKQVDHRTIESLILDGVRYYV